MKQEVENVNCFLQWEATSSSMEHYTSPLQAAVKWAGQVADGVPREVEQLVPGSLIKTFKKNVIFQLPKRINSSLKTYFLRTCQIAQWGVDKYN